MANGDQTTNVSADVADGPAAAALPPRPPDVPPVVTLDPPSAAVIAGVPVRLTGTADPGIRYIWNPADHTWDDGPAVTYTGVQVAVTGGQVARAWAVNSDWSRWAADVIFPQPGAQGATATGSCTTARTVVSAQLPVPVQAPNDRLLPGQSLHPGQQLDTSGQPLRCVMQTDGNLVVYWGGQANFPLWATGTNGRPVTQAAMQTDGNFVLYAGSQPVWATGTNGNPGAYLVLQPDGDLVLFSASNAPIWRSGTMIVTAPPRASSVLPAGGQLNPGQYLQAPRQPYTCVMQGDGNLVVYKLGSSPVWATGTDGKGAVVAIMQGDGNLVLYTAAHVPVWASGTNGSPGAQLVMQDDGNLVIYRPDGTPIWASNTVQPAPPSYWAIVLCKFADLDTEPQPPGWYEDYYSNPAAEGAAAYWQTVTDGIIDVSGSAVFGWFTMAHTTAELASMTFPGDRVKLAQWGRDTAQANGVNLSKFQHVLTVFNYSTDSGAVGVPGDVVIGHGNPQYTDLGFVCHEMGHGFGLVHSWAANPDQEYGDGFDLMSFNTTTFDFPAVTEGVIGWATVGLNAHNLSQLGALGSIASPTAASDFSDPLVLNALTQIPRTLAGASLAFQIPQTDGSSFTVEARRKAQWDRAIPADNSVVISQVRTNGLSYLVPHAGAYFTTGQTFTTPDPAVVVWVGPWQGDQVQIWAWDLPDGALREEVGDPRVYLMQGGQKHWIVNPATLRQIQADTGRVVRLVPAGGLSSVPAGPYIAVLNVSTVPHPPALNVPVQMTVTATDPVTNTAVTGDVIIAGSKAGTTGQPFTYTFRGFAQGSVVAAGYITTPIDFGFPPSTVVPDVVGDAPAEALNAIHAAGLTATIESRPDPTCEHIGEVESQSPAPGNVSLPGAAVTIVIGTHPGKPCL
jgi:PASTA domain